MVIEEKQYNNAFDFKIWKPLFKFFKPYRKLFLISLFAIIGASTGDILFPLFQSYAINNFVQTQSLEGIVQFFLLYLLVILIQASAIILSARCAMKLEMRFGRDVKKELFYHMQTLSLSFYNTTPVGYILSRTMSDTTRIASLIAWTLPDLIWSLFYVLGVFIAMFILNPSLAIIIIVVMPIITLLTWYFQNKILHWNRKARKNNSKITGAFNEGIMGAKTAKTLVLEDINYSDFKTLTTKTRKSAVKAAQLSAIYIPLIVFISCILLSVVLMRGGYAVSEDLMMLGTLSAFTTYALGIFDPIQVLARTLADIISIQADTERVLGLLNEKPFITDTNEVIEKYGDCFNPKPENWPKIKGDITFENISFKYPDGDVNVLEDFNLHVPAGTTVAIVGETGAGKSTLVNLACRFFEPTKGRILIDGVDYKERSQLWLHSNLGYVLQSPHLFSGTVMDNIRYGRLQATDEEVYEAAKAVSANIVVEKLDGGYNNIVGEGGDHLSTGEKQLISFARAVLANPAIFVLDEATSSIDTQTEKLIQDAISHLLNGRTSFIIAHRLSTIRHADIILVVKDGTIVDKGTHKELLNKKSYYYDLYSKQFAEENAMQALSGH